MTEQNHKPFLLTVYGNEGISMEKIKTITCEKCGNSVSQRELPNGDAYYCCHYCGFTSTSASVIIDALEKFNSGTEQGGSYV